MVKSLLKLLKNFFHEPFEIVLIFKQNDFSLTVAQDKILQKQERLLQK